MPRPCGVVTHVSPLLKVANNHWDTTRLPRGASYLSNSRATEQENVSLHAASAWHRQNRLLTTGSCKRKVPRRKGVAC